jgi:hypothetical protein
MPTTFGSRREELSTLSMSESSSPKGFYLGILKNQLWRIMYS